MSAKVILASNSARRRELLEKAAIPFEVITKEVDESFSPELSIEDAVADVALRKALAVKEDAGSENIILAADTVVVQDKDVIGKPNGREEAIKTLMKLQGKTHQVITGVCLLKGDAQKLFTSVTEVSFHPLMLPEIIFYVDQFNPYDKAGAYAIQEWIGLVGIESIKGDYYNVVGLPVNKVFWALQDWIT